MSFSKSTWLTCRPDVSPGSMPDQTHPSPSPAMSPMSIHCQRLISAMSMICLPCHYKMSVARNETNLRSDANRTRIGREPDLLNYHTDAAGSLRLTARCESKVDPPACQVATPNATALTPDLWGVAQSSLDD